MSRLGAWLFVSLAAPCLFAQTISFNAPESYLAPSVSFAIGDFNNDGKPDIVSGANSVALLLGHGDGTFATPVRIAAGLSGAIAASIVAADFNQDSKLDLAIAFYSEPGTIMLLLGNGDGTFKSPTSYSVGNLPVALIAADFTGDNIVDLATGNYGGGISILKGNGDGTFQSAKTSQTFLVQSLAAGKFNADSFLDLAVLDSATHTVTVLFGDGAGAFTAGPQLGSNVYGVKAADVNNDQNQDLVTLEQESAPYGSIYINAYLGSGTGSFQTPKSSPIQNSYVLKDSAGMTLADLNGDGKLDVVAEIGIEDYYSSVRVTELGNGDGTFTELDLTTQPPATGGVNVAAADLNGDSKIDLVATTTGSALLRVDLGEGDGTFRSLAPIEGLSSNLGFYDTQIADFNHDGKQDILTIPYGQPQVYLGNGDGTFQSPITASNYTDIGVVGTADLNGDGFPDLITVPNEYFVKVMLGNGDGTFQAPSGTIQLSGISIQAAGAAIGDFNGDSKLDVAFGGVPSSGKYHGAIILLLGNGDGTFQAPIYVPGADGPVYIQSGDFNADGKPDIAVVNIPSGVSPFISILLNNGDGTFRNSYLPIPSPAQAYDLSVGDFNGDSRDDLLVRGVDYPNGTAQPGVPSLSVLLSNGDGSFENSANYLVNPLFQTWQNTPLAVVADFDGDRKLDFVTSDGTNMLVWKGLGNGTFTPQGFFQSGYIAPMAVDFTGDSKPDLISNASLVPAAPPFVGPSNFQMFLLTNTTP